MATQPKITRKKDGSIKVSDPTVASRLEVLKKTTPKTAVIKPLAKLDTAFAADKKADPAGLGTIDEKLFTPVTPKVLNPFKRKLQNAKSKL